ncbi:MAG: helix-turn-helix transcriptional regulator [Gammaproteobacteria bacterium]|nr:helix-turn-helix transcriptional regulator [Gammaproteobacteria bacterium]
MKNINELLRIMRVCEDWTLKEMSNKIDLSVSYLSEIENGKKEPTLQILEDYSDIFKIDLSDIFVLIESINHVNDVRILRKRLMKKYIEII